MRSFNGGTPSAFTSYVSRTAARKWSSEKSYWYRTHTAAGSLKRSEKSYSLCHRLFLLKYKIIIRRNPIIVKRFLDFSVDSHFICNKKTTPTGAAFLLLSIYPVPSKLHTKKLFHPFSYHHSWLCPRPISNSQLHVLPHFHLCPIYLVVFKGSY